MYRCQQLYFFFLWAIACLLIQSFAFYPFLAGFWDVLVHGRVENTGEIEPGLLYTHVVEYISPVCFLYTAI